jgi:methionyl-tRNA formyltransferase
LRIVFLGSGAFGIATLESLVAQHEVVAVVSQPDRPAGRGKSLTPTPIAARAAELGISVLKPPDVNELGVRETVRGYQADAWVVIAFGQKLSRELLDGVFAINLHGSLLPAYRGAAPIQRAVMDGCAETGVSVISLADRMDAGLVFATRARAIGARETSDEVHDQLALLGPEVVGDVLARHAAGTLVGDVQDESRATRARKLSKAEATVDFAALDAREARARINGLNSWPGCTVLVGELPAKLLRVEECDGAAGEIGVLGPDGVVQARTGAVRILEIQPIGGRGMPVAEFLNGRPGLVGCAVRPFVPARS